MSKKVKPDFKALRNLITSTTEFSAGPRDVWHPDYGWVLRNGEPTETTEAFYESVIKKIEKK